MSMQDGRHLLYMSFRNSAGRSRKRKLWTCGVSDAVEVSNIINVVVVNLTTKEQSNLLYIEGRYMRIEEQKDSSEMEEQVRQRKAKTKFALASVSSYH